MRLSLKALAIALLCFPVIFYVWGAILGPYDWKKVLIFAGVVFGSISLLRVVARVYVRKFGGDGFPAQIDRFFKRYHEK
jgi:hypothetical protein